MIIVFFEIVPMFIMFLIAGLMFLSGVGLMVIAEWMIEHWAFIAILLLIKSIIAGIALQSVFAVPFDFLRASLVVWLIVQQIYSWSGYESLFDLILNVPFDIIGVALMICASLYVLVILVDSLPALGEIASFAVLFILIYLIAYKAAGGWERPLPINQYIPIIKDLQETAISFFPSILPLI